MENFELNFLPQYQYLFSLFANLAKNKFCIKDRDS